MTDRQQQIIYYALIKSFERRDEMWEEIVNEIIENVNEFDFGTLFSIRFEVKDRLKDTYSWDREDKELAVKLLAAVNKGIEESDVL